MQRERSRERFVCRRLMPVASCVLLCLFAAALPGVAADPVFREGIDSDVKSVLILRAGLRRALDFGGSRLDLFTPGRDHAKDLLSRDERMALWTAWSGMLDSLAGLDAIRRERGGFSLFDDEERRRDSFAVGNAAFLAGYRHALEFIALADGNPALDTVLNEEVPELGITAGTFARFKFRFLNVAVASEFAAREVVAKGYADGPEALRDAMAEDARVIWDMGKGKGHELTLKNALAVVQKAGLSAWFPVQRGVAEFMGDTRVRRPGTHLVSAVQVEGMGRRLLPGDLIVERHEWFLSNLGLPGFWTHVAFYVGTPEERRAFFDDPGVREWVAGQGIAGGDFEDLLRRREPQAHASALAPTPDGKPARILEAISEGVCFTSLDYTAASDSIGVLRPRLSPREKAEAILRAFHFAGRPYDFNFDFQTDSALVCSELIHKAYEPAAGMRGLQLPTIEVMGRKVVTPNEIVREFDSRDDDGGPPYEFVLFLDGYEKERRAIESTEEEFRSSWRRPNWHILIQDAPVEAER